MQDIGDGWWEGKDSSGQQGLIPETYVEVSFRSDLCFFSSVFMMCYLLA